MSRLKRLGISFTSRDDPLATFRDPRGSALILSRLEGATLLPTLSGTRYRLSSEAQGYRRALTRATREARGNVRSSSQPAIPGLPRRVFMGHHGVYVSSFMMGGREIVRSNKEFRGAGKSGRTTACLSSRFRDVCICTFCERKV